MRGLEIFALQMRMFHALMLLLLIPYRDVGDDIVERGIMYERMYVNHMNSLVYADG